MIPDDPELEAWLDSARKELVPMIEGSAIGVSLVPTGETDVKFALELGLLIMMNKPILAIVEPGTDVAPKLLAVADKVLYLDDLKSEHSERLVSAAIRELAGPDDDG